MSYKSSWAVAGVLSAALALAGGCSRYENVPTPPRQEPAEQPEETPKPPSNRGNKDMVNPDAEDLVLLA